MSSENNKNNSESGKKIQNLSEASQSEKDYGQTIREKLKRKKPIPVIRIEEFPEITIRGVKETEKKQKGNTSSA